MKIINRLALAFLLMSALFVSCAGESQQDDSADDAAKSIPPFQADSAYAYVARQCSFGPRVPETEQHAACLEWIVAFFRANGADTVIVQEGEMPIYDGTKKRLRNIVAVYDMANENRVMLCSHWDSRPFADNEIDEQKRREPILGADDGASGVGVLMEIGRVINQQKPSVGVDIVLFDLEDWGAPEWLGRGGNNGWCLGSEFWARHTHFPGYKAQYGILLDMVGGANNLFYREYFSETNVKWLNDKVWNTAGECGLSSRFMNKNGGAITDDHLSVLKYAGIPCIDIVAYNPESEDTGFPDYWHTQSDDMRNISTSTLGDVGKLLLTLLY